MLVILLPPIWLKRFAFFLRIAWKLAAHAVVDKVTADTMGVAVDDGVSMIFMSLSATVRLGGSFGFRRCEIFTLLLMMKFCAIDF